MTTELDADGVELTEALRACTRRSTGADVAFVSYLGHSARFVRYRVPHKTRDEVRRYTVYAYMYVIALACVVLPGCDSSPSGPSSTDDGRMDSALCEVSVTHKDSASRDSVRGYVPRFNMRFACGSGERISVLVHARIWTSGHLVGDLHQDMSLGPNSARWLCQDNSGSTTPPEIGCAFLPINNTSGNALVLPFSARHWNWVANWHSCHIAQAVASAECPWPDPPENSE